MPEPPRRRATSTLLLATALLAPLLGACAPDGHDRSLIATGMATKWPGNYQPDHSAAPGVGRPESSDLLPAFVTGAAR